MRILLLRPTASEVIQCFVGLHATNSGSFLIHRSCKHVKQCARILNTKQRKFFCAFIIQRDNHSTRQSTKTKITMASRRSNNCRDGEIVGLHINNHGRSCDDHNTCGNHVSVGDIVILRLSTVIFNEDTAEEEECFKAIKIDDGLETCTIGFLPRHFVYGPRKDDFNGKYCKVLELYKDSTESVKTRKNLRLNGVCSFKFI